MFVARDAALNRNLGFGQANCATAQIGNTDTFPCCGPFRLPVSVLGAGAHGPRAEMLGGSITASMPHAGDGRRLTAHRADAYWRRRRWTPSRACAIARSSRRCCTTVCVVRSCALKVRDIHERRAVKHLRVHGKGIVEVNGSFEDKTQCFPFPPPQCFNCSDFP